MIPIQNEDDFNVDDDDKIISEEDFLRNVDGDIDDQVLHQNLKTAGDVPN